MCKSTASPELLPVDHLDRAHAPTSASIESRSSTRTNGGPANRSVEDLVEDRVESPQL